MGILPHQLRFCWAFAGGQGLTVLTSIVGDKCDCEPGHSFLVRETGHKEDSTSIYFILFFKCMWMSRLDGSAKSLSCFSIKSISSDTELEAKECGIFEFEL